MSSPWIVHVAVPVPTYGHFDYLLPDQALSGEPPANGIRVQVNFGGRNLTGVVIGSSRHSHVEARRLKPVKQVLDSQPVLDPSVLKLLEWAAVYYQHPLGEAVSAALPAWLRQGRAAAGAEVKRWRASAVDESAETLLQRAPRQLALLRLLQQTPSGLEAAQLNERAPNWRTAMAALVDKQLVSVKTGPAADESHDSVTESPELNPAQQNAVTQLLAGTECYGTHVLEGVTGSGKTEVYLAAIQAVIDKGRQALVLVPEIGLTPQFIDRIRRRFKAPLAVLHSGLADGERFSAWLAARAGDARIVLGTRSAIFTPLARPGLIVIDEEHDQSFKQQDGFRYHARDVAVFRARQLNIPVILGSATPALETLHNVRRGKYQSLQLPERAGRGRPPRLDVIDVRRRPVEEGLSDLMLAATERHLDADGQVLLFLNRRGFAPAVLCHDCGWVDGCHRCDAHLTYHAGKRRMCCHHCGGEQRARTVCPECGAEELRMLGEGTERIEQVLQQQFPDASVVRIDRDTTRRKGAMADKLEAIHAGTHQIMVGTQMLSKGHDFPGVTLVGILDVDRGLFSADFRALERMAQLIVQVAGRAGRGEKAGEVLLQTHQPEHPLLQVLLTGGYQQFSDAALYQREEAGLPPYQHMALLRAEAVGQQAPEEFLTSARRQLSLQTGIHNTVNVMGPAPAPMERRAGRYRSQLLVTAANRANLHAALEPWVTSLHKLPGARKVRWSLDVDPVELY